MLKKTPLILLKIGLVTALAILISGCGTEDPWSPDPSRPLDLSMVSGPADTVGYGSDVSFSWTSTGGEGNVLYQYRLDQGSWSTASNATSAAYEDVTVGAVFGVRAADAAANTDEESREFWVGTQPADDTTPPTVEITSSPAEGSFVAATSAVTFTWDGEDDADGDNVLFWYSFAGVTSDTSSARTVTFTNVAAADPATFSVWSLDQSGNPSTADTVSFVIKDATILYIDDYLWPSPAKDRDQKQFYRDALEGYAFAEWDIAAQGMPDSSFVLGFSTILFASDTDLSTTDGTWWYDIGEPGESSIHYFMENGGKLIVTGPENLPWIAWGNPPAPGDFEHDWLGIDDTLIFESADTSWWLDDVEYDTLIVAPDSVTADTTYEDAWANEWWFTWAVKDPSTTLNLPDSMKMDVAKNGDQDDYASGVLPGHLRNDATVTTEPLFTWGLWVDGDPPGDPYYESVVGHLTKFDGEARTAMLNFDTYDFPLPEIRQTFQAILTEFGE